MSVPPPAPWVARIRKAILWAGFAWPLAVFVMALGPKGAGVWAFIGAAFLAELFIPPALVLSLILPTYKGRIVAVPVVLVLVFWWMASQSSTYTGFSMPPYMLLWIVTFTAITLVIPQHSIVKFLFGQLFARRA